MNHLKLLLLALAFLALGGASFAQKAPQGKKIKTLVDYRAELGLTDAQVSDITEALRSFKTNVTEQRKLLTQSEQEYSKLVSDHAPLDQVKQKLRQVTDANFNLRYADVLTSRKVEGILSTEQLSKWRDIQAKVRNAPPKQGM